MGLLRDPSDTLEGCTRPRPWLSFLVREEVEITSDVTAGREKPESEAAGDKSCSL